MIRIGIVIRLFRDCANTITRTIYKIHSYYAFYGSDVRVLAFSFTVESAITNAITPFSDTEIRQAVRQGCTALLQLYFQLYKLDSPYIDIY